MKCKKCGRILKNERSMGAGYGPVCYKRIFGSNLPPECKKYNSSDGITYSRIPEQMDLFDYLQMIGAI